MIVNNVPEKIEKLKNSRPEWDDAALDKMTEWEKGVARLILEEDYATLAITKEITETLREFVKRINRQLLSNSTTLDRGAIIADKNRCLWLLRLICRDFEAEVKDIEKDIDYELEDLA